MKLLLALLLTSCGMEEPRVCFMDSSAPVPLREDGTFDIQEGETVVWAPCIPNLKGCY